MSKRIAIVSFLCIIDTKLPPFSGAAERNDDMNIAIYAVGDPDPEPLLSAVNGFLRRRGLAATVTRFDRAEALWRAMESARFDLLFFMLSGDASLMAAKGARERCMDCQILFASRTPRYAAQAMDYRAIGYLLLPLMAAELDRAMERFLRYYGSDARHYAAHTRLCDHLIPHDTIRYFHSDGHYVNVHVDGADAPVTHLRRIDDIQREVCALPYVRCHQSYLVHRRVIRGISGRTLVLADGERIPVSRKYADDLAQILPEWTDGQESSGN